MNSIGKISAEVKKSGKKEIILPIRIGIANTAYVYQKQEHKQNSTNDFEFHGFYVSEYFSSNSLENKRVKKQILFLKSLSIESEREV